ncbi:MAG: LysR family transcriptional regulator [Gammaproteobacteria bacterium]|jgi:DNA-binding transcriptional LysR family regulator|nr:LysR family transcriptional regulator [Gammaproteobacteria bacterium]
MNTLKELKILSALCKQRHFARAARTLHMSQPALSRAVQRIEDRLGVELFERTPTGAEPTVYARIACASADDLIAGFEALHGAIRAERQTSHGKLRVAFGPFVAEALGTAAFAGFAATESHLLGEMVVRNWRGCIDELQERRADLAVTDLAAGLASDRLDGEPLGAMAARFYCCPDHPLAQRAEVTWADVASYPWALTRVQSRIAQKIPVPLREAGHIDPETGDFIPAVCVESVSAMKAAVGEGRAVSVAPPRFLRPELACGALRLLPLHAPWLRISYGLLWRRDAPPKGPLAEFVSILRERQGRLDQTPQG